MARAKLFLSALAAACVFLAPSAASAAFLYCNHTQNTVEAAFGYREQEGWISEGWWQIEPGQCARVYNKPLMQRFYFYYAHVLAPPSKDGKPPMVWTGKYAFCTDKKAFRVEGDGDCESRGYQTQGFQEIDLGATQKDYTLTFLDGTGK
jgi:uncharacterized membrane protein